MCNGITVLKLIQCKKPWNTLKRPLWNQLLISVAEKNIFSNVQYKCSPGYGPRCVCKVLIENKLHKNLVLNFDFYMKDKYY